MPQKIYIIACLSKHLGRFTINGGKTAIITMDYCLYFIEGDLQVINFNIHHSNNQKTVQKDDSIKAR